MSGLYIFTACQLSILLENSSNYWASEIDFILLFTGCKSVMSFCVKSVVIPQVCTQKNWLIFFSPAQHSETIGTPFLTAIAVVPVSSTLLLYRSSHFNLSSQADSLIGFWFPLIFPLISKQWFDFSLEMRDCHCFKLL